MAKHYPQMVCHTQRQQRQKKQSHIYRNHLCFWRSEALCPTGHSFHELCWHRVCSMSSADTECVPWAVLTQSVLLVWNAALALPHPPSPVPALSPRPGKAAPRCCPENTSGETKPMCRFLKYWLRYLLLPPKVYVATVLLLVFPAPSSHPRVFHCSSSALRPASFGGTGTRGVAVGI